MKETYGRRGHRLTAVQTKLTIFGRENSCIFKMSGNGRLTFYKFSLDRENYTYKYGYSLLIIIVVQLQIRKKKRN